MADDYPTDMEVGEAGEIILGVVNHEYSSITYLLEVRLDKTIMGDEKLHLEHNEMWQQPFFFEADEKVKDRKVEFLLYRDQDRNESDETREPYLSLHLWVDVG